MSEILLRTLTNADIDWLVTTGRQHQLETGTILLNPGETPDTLHVLLSGRLTVAPYSCEIRGEPQIGEMTRGELVGLSTLLEGHPSISLVKAAQPSTVLSISQQQLRLKLQQDVRFAAHFYKAAALMLSEQLRSMFEMPEKAGFTEGYPVREALAVFGEFQDSDIDWLVAAGQLRRYAPDQVLLHAGRPVDALYIILDGLFSVALPDGGYDPLSLCFSGLEEQGRSQTVFADMAKGGLPGIAAFLDSRPLPVTFRAVRESLIFMVPRQQMDLKLQQDYGFAARFYTVIATQLADLLYSMMGHLGCELQTYSQHEGMDEATDYSDELDLDSLQQLSQGANRFNWMLSRLGVAAV